jgi:hypothetical protein
MAAGLNICMLVSSRTCSKPYGMQAVYLCSIPIKHGSTNCSARELDEVRQRPNPGHLRWREVCELVRAVVLLQYAETAREAQAPEEDAEATKGVEPGFCAAIGRRAELREVVGGGG